jgi:hypothetical protein
MQKIKVELIENFLVVWNSKEGSELYKTAYYGKPVGIASRRSLSLMCHFGFDGGPLP